MKGSSQIRIRVSGEVAEKFSSLPPRLRARAVSFLLSSVEQGIDLDELLKSRSELVSLGVLINQALRTSWGQTTDAIAMRELAKKLGRILA